MQDTQGRAVADGDERCCLQMLLQGAIEKAKKAGELVSAGADMLKGKLSNALQQNPQATAAKETGAAALSAGTNFLKSNFGWGK